MLNNHRFKIYPDLGTLPGEPEGFTKLVEPGVKGPLIQVAGFNAESPPSGMRLLDYLSGVGAVR